MSNHKKEEQFKGKTTLKEMTENWAEFYGEDLANDYSGFYDDLYEKYGNDLFDIEEADDAWKTAYGESLQDEYEGFWASVGGKVALDYDPETGVFFDREGNEFENPDEDEYMVYHDKGKGYKEKISPSEYKKLMTSPKPPTQFGKDVADVMKKGQAVNENNAIDIADKQFKDKQAVKPQEKPMKEINLDQKLKESGTKLDKKTEGALDKAFNKKK